MENFMKKPISAHFDYFQVENGKVFFLSKPFQFNEK